MKDNIITASIIFGVCLIISAALISSGLKSLGRDISDAGSSIGRGIADTNEKIIRID